MSNRPWGTGKTPPRCTFFVSGGYKGQRRVQCRQKAVAAVQTRKFKNGRWDRPYPVCVQHLNSVEGGHQVTSLEMYVAWLKSEPNNLNCYQRKP